MQSAKLKLSKLLLSSLVSLASFVALASFSFAKAPVILEYPLEVEEIASASARVRFEMAGSSQPFTSYFLKLAFFATPSGSSKNYFGQTWVADHWIRNSENYAKQLPVVTDTDRVWEGEIGFMVDSEDSGYAGAGVYNLVAGRYTASGSGPEWSEPILVSVLSQPIPPTPPTPPSDYLSDITHMRSLPLGTKITTEGLVTVEQGPLGADVFYLEDDFAGIKVDLPKDFKSGVHLGDKVRLGCTIEESRGEKYIKFDESSAVAILGTNLVCRSPHRIGTGEVLDNWEGRFVEVEAPVAVTEGDTFYLDDGSGRIKVYIKESTGIQKPPMRQGDLVRVKGIISQWGQHDDGSDNYRLMPRYPEDLVIFPQTEEGLPSEALTKEGAVLGAVTSLPETGGSRGFFPMLLVSLLLLVLLLDRFERKFHDGKSSKDEQKNQPFTPRYFRVTAYKNRKGEKGQDQKNAGAYNYRGGLDFYG